MHSSVVRIQNLFGFFTTVTFIVGLGVAFSSIFLQKEIEDVKVNVRNVQVAGSNNRVKGRQNQYYSSKPTEQAFIKFDLEADLEPLFHWNTKQIFAYLTASYPGRKYEFNDAVVWDIIIPSKEKAKLKLRNQRAKYVINDVTNKFREQNATLTFGWNVQPHVGALTWNEKGVGTFSFPPLKAKKKN
ncbi:signal peptidase 22kDa subunit [Tirmania nivea]|nr:signal peptidase 22kDa subunit [Tirmania nivea]